MTIPDIRFGYIITTYSLQINISAINNKWYTGLPCAHWKHTSLRYSDRQGDCRMKYINYYMNGSYMCLIYVCMYIAMYMACGYIHTFKKLGFNRQSVPKLQQQVQGKSHHENYHNWDTWPQACLITRQLIENSAICWCKIDLDMILYDSSHLEIERFWIIQ